MSKVYFSKSIDKIIDQVDMSALGNKVAIKVHFGEKGCTTFLNSEYARKAYDKLISAGKEAILVECNVLYKGSRTNSTDHIKTAREHGFDMPIDILDGEYGQEFVEMDGCKIGKGLEKYDSMIVLSHFKGHMETGFGGAIKNIGMGLGSRAGKLDMHSSVRPSIGSKCIGCGVCAAHCNAGAISIQDGKASIDKGKCEGCAICIAYCNSNAILIPWEGRTAEGVQKKVAEYAAAVLKIIPKTLYINVLENITEYCDCMGVEQKPFMPDVGIVYSGDIVAIEKASLDLADKISEGKFKSINMIDKDKQIEFVSNLGLGEGEYELIKI
jgi:uncharacterized protein